jgi:hypothetical protein
MQENLDFCCWCGATSLCFFPVAFSYCWICEVCNKSFVHSVCVRAHNLTFGVRRWLDRNCSRFVAWGFLLYKLHVDEIAIWRSRVGLVQCFGNWIWAVRVGTIHAEIAFTGHTSVTYF